MTSLPDLPESSGKAAAFAEIFQLFRRLLSLNNEVLEKIAAMESALAGEYVFDKKFLVEVTGELIDLVREVIYCLNNLTGNAYLGLYDRYEEIAGKLSVLAGGYAGPYDHSLTLPYALITSDFDGLVGNKNATLSEIHNHLHLRVPAGFAITVAAYHLFMQENDLFARIDEVRAEGIPRKEQAQRIGELFGKASLPHALVMAVQEELPGILAGCGPDPLLAVRSSAVGEDGETRSFAGQFRSVLEVSPELSAVLDAYRQVLASRFSLAALEYLGPDSDSRAVPMAVGVQLMNPSRVAGVTYSRTPDVPEENSLLITSVRGAAKGLVSGRTTADRFTVSRTWPFPLLESEFFTPMAPVDQEAPLSFLANGLRRGSSSLLLEEIRKIAEQALLLEKAFDGPQDIEWAWGKELVILQSRPFTLPVKPLPLPHEIAAELQASPPIMEGRGQIAQLGIGAGLVVQVDQETDPEQFPMGAVAVARFPDPRLSPIVWKASVIITDIGGPTGHLATIAREYRTPALFGTGEATRLLTPGEEVTVDVENKKVYRGVISGLLRLQVTEDSAYRGAPELRTLRKLLRWIAPLTLANPAAADFIPENCRTFHDILRFSHEKGIDGLIHFHEEHPGQAGLPSYPVRLPAPLKLRVIDLGSGLKGKPARPGGEITPELLNCRPLAAILAGFYKEAAQGREPAPLGLKEILAGLGKPLTALTGRSSYPGDNLAIIADNYCNLCLRLGYHFNVVDAFFSPEPDNNYIYFRFVGGLASQSKRKRRARLISDILTGLYFKVERTGDLVIAKARNLDPPRMERVLSRLGELISFTRQLDVQMRDEADIERFFVRFLASVQQEQAGSAR
ncbi:MAG: PEP/pyruvate-binding domain-containing protein [Desulfurivibrionaceae bacterium]